MKRCQNRPNLIIMIPVFLVFMVLTFCKGPTGGDYTRPTVTFPEIPMLVGEAYDDSILTTTTINLNAHDDDAVKEVDLYIINLDLEDTSKVVPVAAFSSAPYSYTWNLDATVKSGEYKFLATVFDKVGYYYQEERKVLVRGHDKDASAMTGTVSGLSSAEFKKTNIFLYNSDGDVLTNTTPLKAQVMSNGTYKMVDINEFGGLVPVAKYAKDADYKAIYADAKSQITSRSTNSNVNITMAGNNYDQLSLSAITPSTRQDVFVSGGGPDSANFTFTYNAFVSSSELITSTKNSWLVISVVKGNTFDADITSAIELGDIGQNPGVTGNIVYAARALSLLTGETYEVKGGLIVNAANSKDAMDAFQVLLNEGSVVSVGSIISR